MSWQPSSATEPDFVPLTDRMLAMRGHGETPEEILLAKEMAGEGQEPARAMSSTMRRALLTLTAETPGRIWKMLDWLPLEEAYALRRYVLNGDGMAAIGDSTGITKQGVKYRLYRAIWRLRVLQDVAWDLGERELWAAVAEHLADADARLLVVFWRERFSQSRTAHALGCWQSLVHRSLRRVEGELAPWAAKAGDLKRVHWTLLQVRHRKLTIAAYRPMGHAMRLPAPTAALRKTTPSRARARG